MTTNFRDDFIEKFHEDIDRIDSGDLIAYAPGDFLLLEDPRVHGAWIEGKAVNLGDHR
jgi:hypothetical protein